MDYSIISDVTSGSSVLDVEIPTPSFLNKSRVYIYMYHNMIKIST